MKSVLEELYFGNIRPFATRNTCISENHISYMEEFREKFLNTLTESQREAFFSYESHMSEITSSAECEAFVKGFRLGVQILMEGMKEEKTG